MSDLGALGQQRSAAEQAKSVCAQFKQRATDESLTEKKRLAAERGYLACKKSFLNKKNSSQAVSAGRLQEDIFETGLLPSEERAIERRAKGGTIDVVPPPDWTVRSEGSTADALEDIRRQVELQRLEEERERMRRELETLRTRPSGTGLAVGAGAALVVGTLGVIALLLRRGA